MKNLAAWLALLLPVLASASEEAKELPDLLSPAELAVEIMENGTGDIDGVPTGAPRLFVLVDKSEQRLWTYEDGAFTGSWLISSGTEQKKCAPSKCYRAHTPVGVFTPYRMHYTYTSKLWNARMDRAVFIVGGIALHATFGENIPLLGTRASGGCIRQHPTNADLLYRKVKYYGMANTRVQVQE